MISFIAYFNPPTLLGILNGFMVICASKFDKKYAHGSTCIGNLAANNWAEIGHFQTVKSTVVMMLHFIPNSSVDATEINCILIRTDNSGYYMVLFR